MSTGPRLVVDPAAVMSNVAALRGPAGTPLMAVVKADGFGLGARTVATAALAAGASRLGTATWDEAVEVADLGVPVLSWLNAPDRLAEVRDVLTSDAPLEVAVGSFEHLAALTRPVAAAGRRRAARVHLFVDTGMSRDGCPPADWAALCHRARTAVRAGLVEVVGVMGHLGCGDEPEAACHLAAVDVFARALRTARALGLRPSVVHLAATAAALSAPGTHHGLLRTGAGLVGIDPTGSGALRPAARLEAPLVQVRRARAGSLVGYGHDHVLERDTWLGLLPLGYADGLPRAASGRAEVLVEGRRRPLVGLVSMDQSVVDLGDDPVATGTWATVFGDGSGGEPTPGDWARWSGTIEHEVLTGVGRRVARTTRTGARVDLPVAHAVRSAA